MYGLIFSTATPNQYWPVVGDRVTEGAVADGEESGEGEVDAGCGNNDAAASRGAVAGGAATAIPGSPAIDAAGALAAGEEPSASGENASALRNPAPSISSVTPTAVNRTITIREHLFN